MRRVAFLLLLAMWQRQALGEDVDALKKAIEERDAVIRELREKIDALERKKDAMSPAASPEAPKPGPEATADDEELSRALERTLVQQGILLLPAGTYELQPEASYARWDKSRGPMRYETGAALSLRAGLPHQSQFQMRVPYVHASTSVDSTSALGDVDVSLARQLVREEAAWPGVVASVGFSARTGKDAFGSGAPTGSGFNVLQAGLTAVKRKDPVMFYGGASYSAALSREIAGTSAQPGDALGVRFGGILAASPETAINLGMNLAFVRAARLNGVPVPDSETTLATLQIGVGSILSRSMLFNLTADIRLTGNVPDFRLTATLPIRF